MGKKKKLLKRQRDASDFWDEGDFRLVAEELPISSENFQRDAAQQPVAFLRASRLRVKCLQARLQLDYRLRRAKIEAALEFRTDAESDGRRVTVQQVDDAVESAPEVVELRQLLDDSRCREEGSRLLVEAFQQRGKVFERLTENRE